MAHGGVRAPPPARVACRGAWHTRRPAGVREARGGRQGHAIVCGACVAAGHGGRRGRESACGVGADGAREEIGRERMEEGGRERKLEFGWI